MMIIDYLRMIIDNIPTNATLCFDILMQFSLFLLVIHMVIEAICKVLRLYTWSISLLSVVFAIIISFLALSSQMASFIKHKTLTLETPFSIFQVLPTISVVWLIIMIVSIGFFIYSRHQFSTIVKISPICGDDEVFEDAKKLLGMNHNIQCKVVSSINMVGVYGILTPVIVIPKHFMDEYKKEDRMLLYLHELKHIQRKDFIAYSIIQFLKVVFYLHIPMKWQLQKLELCIEQLCDESVMKLLPDPMVYSKLLFHAVKNNHHAPVSFVNINYHLVRQRMEALFFKKNKSLKKKSTFIILLFLMTGLLVYNAQVCNANHLEREHGLHMTLLIENLDHTLEVIPVNNMEEAKSIALLRDTNYIQVKLVDQYIEGIFGIYSNGKRLVL